MSDKENGGYVLMTWPGFLHEGRNSYDKITATRELTNNIVVPISTNKKYTMQVVVDSDSEEITFTDNLLILCILKLFSVLGCTGKRTGLSNDNSFKNKTKSFNDDEESTFDGL